MQQSWRSDNDKLTFIACLPVDGAPEEMLPGSHDGPDRMLGDVNLFLTAHGVDPHDCVGELEIMIARPSFRRHGYGRAAIVAFLHYIATNLPGILQEYRGNEGRVNRLSELRVKIGSQNEKSINLFESIGLIKSPEGPNYFNEIKLTWEGSFDPRETARLLQEHGIKDYQELAYSKIGG